VKSEIRAKDGAAPSAMVFVRQLDRSFDRLGSGVRQKGHVQVARQELGQVVPERGQIRREVRLVHLHPPLFGEAPPGGENARVVVPVVEHADAPGQVEDAPSVALLQVGPLGAVDQFPAEPERRHQADLACVHVAAVQVVRLADAQPLALLKAYQVGHEVNVLMTPRRHRNGF
jgi:hypothetical protein